MKIPREGIELIRARVDHMDGQLMEISITLRNLRMLLQRVEVEEKGNGKKS